jgi:hypothetical protein
MGGVGEKPLFLLCVYHFTVWVPVMLSSFAAHSDKNARKDPLTPILLGGIMLMTIVWSFIRLGYSGSLYRLASWVAGPRSTAITTATLSFGIWIFAYLLVLGILGLIEELYAFIQKIKKLMERM